MTNEEKYKTPQERERAFQEYCQKEACWYSCFYQRCSCLLQWLALEAEKEKPLPCPFCGEDGGITELKEGGFRAFCWKCLSASSVYSTKADAIAAWNRRAK